jgi:hypothetical protein
METVTMVTKMCDPVHRRLTYDRRIAGLFRLRATTDTLRL